MVAVLALAAYVRIHDIYAQGLWGDEGWSIWLARGDTLRDLTMTMVYDHHGPIYSTMLRGWELVAGETVIALRWITVLFSIASIALIYRLGRALFNPLAGVLAALAFALMDKHVVLTQEVRDYPMVYFTMIAIALYYVRWRDDPRGGNGFWFVFWSVFGLYLHYYCYMVNLAIGIHALLTLRGRGPWRNFLALNGLIALAFLPWVFVVINQFIYTPVDEEVLNTTHGLPFNRWTVEYLTRETLGTPAALYGLLLVLGGLGPISDRLPGPMRDLPRQRRLSGALLAVLWFGVPIIITGALHQRYPLLTDRNISVIMPAVALLVGFGFTALERTSGRFVVALVIVNGLFTTSSYFDKPPWREMAHDIAAYYPGDGEPVLLDVEGAHAALWYHLSLELPLDVDHVVNLLPDEAEEADIAVSLLDRRKRYQDDFVPYIQGRIAETPGLWLAYWGDEIKKNDIFAVLDFAGFTRTATLEYEHLGFPIYAYRYDREAALDAQTLASFGGETFTLHRRAWLEPAQAGEALNVLLWWRAAAPPDADYTVSVFLLDDSGQLRAQHDSYPMLGATPTTAWTPGEPVFDAHPVPLPDDLAPGTYTVAVKLYTWWDGAVLPADDGSPNGGEYAVLGTVRIE